MIIPIRKPAPITSSDTPGERVIILKRELDRVVDDINRQTAELDRRIDSIRKENGAAQDDGITVTQDADGYLTIL